MKTNKYSTICILLFLIALQLYSANKIKITVHTGNYDRKNCVIETDIQELNPDEHHTIELYEITNNSQKIINSQLVIEKGNVPKLCFILSGNTTAKQTRTFIAKRIKIKNATEQTEAMTVEDTHKSLIIKDNNKPVLVYNYTVTPPPPGVEKKFERSGYIHPAYTPSGFVLTTIQPKDHRHHYGIWNPWTKLEYDGQIYDLWNLGDEKGTVRATTIDEIFHGPIMSGYNAGLEHVIFCPGGEKVIMNEEWKVKAWNFDGGFLWDFESILAPSTTLSILLKEYRYAGFGYRANEEWTKENCLMVTSEGNTRQQIDGTRARWIYITGETGQGHGGLLFLGSPKNYNAPEPLRIWDEQANGGRGDAFINFAPTKNMDWKLEPNHKYTLHYRLFAYDGDMTPIMAEKLWTDFANPPIIIKEIKN